METKLITVNREALPTPTVNYLPKMVASLRENVTGWEEITLMVGQIDTRYFEPFGFREVIPLKEYEQQGLAGHVKVRSAYNYLRALTHGDMSQGVLVLEDDLIFTRDFNAKLAAVLLETIGDEYALTLYTPNIELPNEPGLEQVKPTLFFGTQATYLTPGLRQGFAEYLSGWLANPDAQLHDVAQDLALGRYCQEKVIPIFAANPNLVQHVGEQTTGCTIGKAHVSRSFTL